MHRQRLWIVKISLFPKGIKIMGVKGVKGIDLLQTRLFGSKMYVDIEISADGTIPLDEAHDIAENVHHTIESKFKNVKHCMVHVNPVNE